MPRQALLTALLKVRHTNFKTEKYPAGAIRINPFNNKWVATLYLKGEGSKHLGYFCTKREALEEYQNAKLQFTGEG
jgi:hypothetical protein